MTACEGSSSRTPTATCCSSAGLGREGEDHCNGMKLDGGKIAEVVLNRSPGNTDEPVVIENLKYWGTPRNDGFVMMKNEVQALREVPSGEKPFEFTGTNGFMITFDIKSDDVKK